MREEAGIKELSEVLDYTFRNPALERTARIHSCAPRCPGRGPSFEAVLASSCSAMHCTGGWPRCGLLERWGVCSRQVQLSLAVAATAAAMGACSGAAARLRRAISTCQAAALGS